MLLSLEYIPQISLFWLFSSSFLKGFYLGMSYKVGVCDGYFENVNIAKWWVMCSVTGGSH